MVGQLPKADTVDYILEPPPEEELEPGDSVDSDKKKTVSSSSSKGGIILFAVDISSSMAVTVDIPELQGTCKLCEMSVLWTCIEGQSE